MSGGTPALAAAAGAVVVTPQVRVVSLPASGGDDAADERDAGRDAAFEEQHRPREVEERRALNGCVWFRGLHDTAWNREGDREGNEPEPELGAIPQR
jgi:hypothetical protein